MRHRMRGREGGANSIKHAPLAPAYAASMQTDIGKNPVGRAIWFIETRLGPLLSDETRAAVARAESRAQGLAIAFMSPEFQRR